MQEFKKLRKISKTNLEQVTVLSIIHKSTYDPSSDPIIKRLCYRQKMRK